MSRRRSALVLTVVSALGLAAPLPGQETQTRIEPQPVRVGEAFTIGVTVTQETSGEIHFPALIELPEAMEQRGAVQIRSTSGGREWVAEYPVVAWRADSTAMPRLEIGIGPEGTRSLAIDVPEVAVHTVLPAADTTELALRDPKPFLRATAFPWWLLLLLAGLAALAWWLRRRRSQPELEPVPAGPGGRALFEFDRLRTAWLEGRLTGDRFYDGYEATLRRYARATRGWAPSRALRSLGDRDRPLLDALKHSVLARFARVRATEDGPLEDLDAGAAFVRSEMTPAPEEASESGSAATGTGIGASHSEPAASESESGRASGRASEPEGERS